MKHKSLILIVLVLLSSLAVGYLAANADTLILQASNPSGGGKFIEMTQGGDPSQPFNLAGGCVLFPGDPDRPDCTLNIGYNNQGGGPGANGEGFYTQWESHYVPAYNPDGQYEYHLNAFGRTPDGKPWNLRPIAVDVRKSDGNAAIRLRGATFGFATPDETGIWGANVDRVRFYTDVYAQTDFSVGGVWGDYMRIEDGKLGFWSATPKPKLTCATPEECMTALEAYGLINYIGND